MFRFVRVCVVMCAALALSACLVPEKFVASVNFKPDGGYLYKYEGTAVHFLAAAVIKEEGAFAREG